MTGDLREELAKRLHAAYINHGSARGVWAEPDYDGLPEHAKTSLGAMASEVEVHLEWIRERFITVLVEQGTDAVTVAALRRLPLTVAPGGWRPARKT